MPIMQLEDTGVVKSDQIDFKEIADIIKTIAKLKDDSGKQDNNKSIVPSYRGDPPKPQKLPTMPQPTIPDTVFKIDNDKIKAALLIIKKWCGELNIKELKELLTDISDIGIDIKPLIVQLDAFAALKADATINDLIALF